MFVLIYNRNLRFSLLAFSTFLVFHHHYHFILIFIEVLCSVRTGSSFSPRDCFLLPIRQLLFFNVTVTMWSGDDSRVLSLIVLHIELFVFWLHDLCPLPLSGFLPDRVSLSVDLFDFQWLHTTFFVDFHTFFIRTQVSFPYVLTANIFYNRIWLYILSTDLI